MYHSARLSCAFLLSLLPIIGCSADRDTTVTSSVTSAASPRTPWLTLLPENGTPNLSANGAPVYHAASSSASEMRVMSFNIRLKTIFDGLNHWNFRRDLLVDTIRNFDPDLLGTQECLAPQTDYLRRQLADYQFVGAGRSNGKRRGEMCGIFFRADRFELVDSGHFWLSTRPTKPGSKSWGSMFPRIATWVKLRPRSGGQTFCFFNTHLDNMGSRARLEQARLLRRQIVAIGRGLPTIITGDFNTDPDSKPYQALTSGSLSGLRLTDTFRAAHPQATKNTGTRHGFRGSRRGPRIDWILACAAFQSIDADIVHDRARRYPSDHFPVTALLRPLPPDRIANIE